MGATLKALIARRGLKVGTYVAEFATPGIGHLVRSAAGEFVLFGMEHSGFAMETTKTVLRYLEAANMPTIVHVPTQDYRDVARALDIGAEAIMTPMIATAAQAKAVLACMKYPPAGRRSKGTLPAYERLAMPTVEQHIAEANYFFFSGFGLSGAPDDAKLKALKGKDELVQALKDSYAFAQKGMDSMTAQNAFVTVGSGKMQMTRAGWASICLFHSMDHYGQMVEYLRMNGIVPPASAKPPKGGSD